MRIIYSKLFEKMNQINLTLEDLKISAHMVDKTLREIQQGKNIPITEIVKISDTYQWHPNEFLDFTLDEAVPVDVRTGNRDKIMQCDLDGKYVADFLGYREAERKTGISHTTICACTHGHRKTAGGFTWKLIL